MLDQYGDEVFELVGIGHEFVDRLTRRNL